MKNLYVMLNNGELQYVEFDEKETSMETMLEMLKEEPIIKEIYDGISNTGPIGLLWKREEIKDSVEHEPFEYRGVSVQFDEEEGKWIDSNGHKYMGYLEPRDIKYYINRDLRTYDNKKIFDDMESDEYERLLKYAPHSNVLGRVYYSSEFAKELFDDVYSRLGYPQDEKWIIAPEVLRDDAKMEKLYSTLREAVISELKKYEYAFDTSYDKRYGQHEGTKEILNLFDIKKSMTFDAIDTSIIDSLIKDEEEAIKAYDDAIKTAQTEKVKQLYEHIKTEEVEHLNELNKLKDEILRG